MTCLQGLPVYFRMGSLSQSVDQCCYPTCGSDYALINNFFCQKCHMLSCNWLTKVDVEIESGGDRPNYTWAYSTIDAKLCVVLQPSNVVLKLRRLAREPGRLKWAIGTALSRSFTMTLTVGSLVQDAHMLIPYAGKSLPGCSITKFIIDSQPQLMHMMFITVLFPWLVSSPNRVGNMGELVFCRYAKPLCWTNMFISVAEKRPHVGSGDQCWSDYQGRRWGQTPLDD